jgi:aminopeptidase N
MSTATEPASKKPVEYFRKDYTPPPYSIKEIYLLFELDPLRTTVCATNQVFLTPQSTGQDMVLDGEELELLSVSINKQTLIAGTDYKYEDDKLTIFGSSIEQYRKGENVFTLDTRVAIQPAKNLALSGLYKSTHSDLLSTQCEAMGFRRITFSLDRPDVLATYTVRLEADKELYPLLLSNGNKIDSGDITGSDSNKHYAVWHDPFPKPSYLFALVAGQLAGIEDTYTTTSGRVVKLGIYSEPMHINKLQHAMYSLKESMKWDEDTFGLECDLDIYNVVATDDFNMGAMYVKLIPLFL